MRFKIYENGQEINCIVADEPFVSSYCEENGYTFEKVSIEKQNPSNLTLEDRVRVLESGKADQSQVDELTLMMADLIGGAV